MSNINKIRKKVKKINSSFDIAEENMSIVLSGRTKFLSDIIEAGNASVTLDHLGVVNRIVLDDMDQKEEKVPSKPTFPTLSCDCLIIGASLLGISVLKELSRYDLSCILIDDKKDVMDSEGTLNERVAHTPLDYRNLPKSRYYFQGSYDALKKMLDEANVEPFKVDEMVLYRNRKDGLLVKSTMGNASMGRAKSIRSHHKLSTLGFEPDLVKYVYKSVTVQSTGTVNAFDLGTSLLDNALNNGAELYLDTSVLGMIKEGKYVSTVITDRGAINPKIIINCAGLHSDEIADFAKDRTFTNLPYKRTVFRISPDFNRHVHSACYYLPKNDSFLDPVWYKKLLRFNKTPQSFIEDGYSIFPLPDGSMIAMSKTYPSETKNDFSVSEREYKELFSQLKEVFPSLRKEHIESYKTILVSRTFEKDRLIRDGIFTKNIIETAGIDDSCVSLVPRMTKKIMDLAIKYLESKSVIIRENKTHSSKHESHNIASNNPTSLRNKLIKTNPKYGEMLNERVSVGDAEDVILKDRYISDVSSVKRRLGLIDSQDGLIDYKIEDILRRKKRI